MFQSSFELTGYITGINVTKEQITALFQSSFELTGYITTGLPIAGVVVNWFQSSFELTGYITVRAISDKILENKVSKLFRAYGLYNSITLTS